MKYKKMNRLLSGILVAAMLLTNPSVAMLATAAGEYYVKFKYDDATPATSIATILEGGHITIESALPPDHTYRSENPFLISDKDGNPEAGTPFIIKGDQQTGLYILSAQSGSAKGTPPGDPRVPGETQYTLAPQLIANIVNGSGSISVPATTGLPGTPGVPGLTAIAPTQPFNGSIDTLYTKGSAKLAVITDSSFTFRVTSDETPDGGIGFGTISAATGIFGGLINRQISVKGVVERKGNLCTINIETTGNVGTAPQESFAISVTLPANIKLVAGTEFTVTYTRQPLSPLILTVMTPRSMVDTVAGTILSKPEDPAFADGKNPFIKLDGGSLRGGLTANFHLLTQLKKNNADMDIGWEWKPDRPEDAGAVTIDKNGNPRLATITPKKENITGALVAVVSYKLNPPYVTGGTTVSAVESAPVSIPITILGTGDLPTIVPINQTIGAITTNITAMPNNMDVYDDSVVGYGEHPKFPWQFTGNMTFGRGRGHAEKVVITAPGEPGAVEVYLGGSPSPYTLGTDIKNTDGIAGSEGFRVKAKKAGSIELIFTYYVFNDKKVLVPIDPIKVPILIDDSTPLSIAEFSNIQLSSEELKAFPAAYPNGVIGEPHYKFNKDIFPYDIKLPNKVETLIVAPTIPPALGISTMVEYSVSGLPTIPDGILDLSEASTTRTLSVPLTEGSARTIQLQLTAQDGRKQRYTLKVLRMPRDQDSALKDLVVSDENSNKLLQNFLPSQFVYTIEVPYSMHYAKFDAKTNSLFAATPVYDPELEIKDAGGVGEKMWRRLTHPDDPIPFFQGPATTSMKITVQAEAGVAYQSIYTVNITRKDPNTNNLATSVVPSSTDGKPIAFEYQTVFDKMRKDYQIRIPYSMKELWLDVLPDATESQEVQVTVGDGTPTGVLATVTENYEVKGKPVRLVLAIPPDGSPALPTLPPPTTTTFELKIAVQSEDGKHTPAPYTIKVTRDPPNTDSVLASMTLTDQDNKPVPKFAFNPQSILYDVPVSFQTDRATVTPKARSPLATIEVVDGSKVIKIEEPLQPGYSFDLKTEQVKTILVRVTAEDGVTMMEYTLNITRAKASGDARLKSLTAGAATEFTPKFVADTYNYSVTIPEGTASITFTAVPVNEYSTMTIDGVELKSGTASAPIEPLTPKSTVVIEVTAQDGKTKAKYTVTVTNRNMIGKNNNADLESLRVDYGSMFPRFQPAVIDYEVGVKDDTSSVNIYPIPWEATSTVEVFAGTKKLGDYYNNYASALVDGENDFMVKVTAEDGKTVKEYTMKVYRKDEEKQGNLKPITADMINYEQEGNTIVVDISRYTVVTAEVFNTLKEKYPEKTMVFQGNDYSLQIKGKDLDRLIPYGEVFDLSMSYTTPEEDKIWALIQFDHRNEWVDPVFIYFNQHGALPAPMLLTLSLGHNYRNESATWNYYNTERDRIDYYGGVRTNSRGTFSVQLTHMSTYIYSFDRIIGAENKSGTLGGVGGITGSTSGKPNPNTGSGGVQP